MSKATVRSFEQFKLEEARNIDKHLDDGAKWIRERLAEVRSEKSRATAENWLRLHAAECALMDEIATRQNRRAR